MRERRKGPVRLPLAEGAETDASANPPAGREPTDHERSIAALPRHPGDDFFCLRYRVWYSSMDCAFRTRFETAPGCLQCEQGRFNLKRHQRAVHPKLYRLPVRREQV